MQSTTQNPKETAGTAAAPNPLLLQVHHHEVGFIQCDGHETERAPGNDGLELGASNQSQSGVDTKKNSNVMESTEREICAVVDIGSSNNDGSSSPEDEEGSSCREQVCRICQLDSEHEGENAYDLVQLGCACKDDLGLSHYHCAEVWFTRKGNRTCEICGKLAKNIMGIEDAGFRRALSPEYNNNEISRSTVNTLPMSSHHGDRSHFCLKSFCNFIFACFLVLFFMPWVYHLHKP